MAERDRFLFNSCNSSDGNGDGRWTVTATETMMIMATEAALMITTMIIAANHNDSDNNSNGDRRPQYECGLGGKRRA